MIFGLWRSIDYFITALFEGGSFFFNLFEIIMKKVYLINKIKFFLFSKYPVFVNIMYVAEEIILCPSTRYLKQSFQVTKKDKLCIPLTDRRTT